jgi:NAD(P)-dependent dehydrogenase (short-subunit alcohol dehydrogenase family)
MTMTTVALITGANRGLNFETARELGRTGIRTIIGARDPAKGEQAATELRGEGLDTEDLAEAETLIRPAAEHVEREAEHQRETQRQHREKPTEQNRLRFLPNARNVA